MLTNIDSTASLWLISAAGLTAKALVIIAAAMLAVKLLSRLSSSVRFLILFYALAATLLLPLLSSTLPAWTVVPNWFDGAIGPAATAALEATPPAATPVDARTATSGVADTAPANGESTPGATRRGPGAAAIALGLWLFGLLVLAARTGFSLRHLCRLRRQAMDLGDLRWLALLEDAARVLGMSRLPELRFHPEPIMPITVGLRRPVVLLPVEALDWPAERRRDVLLHELAHLKRKDLACEWISLIACMLQWFNPLVWWAQRKMIVERERACDDMVLNAGADPSRYADCLLKTAAEFQAAPAPSPGMARASDLETRLLAVLDTTRQRGRASAYMEIAMVAVGLVLVMPISSLALDKDSQAAVTGVATASQGAQRRDIDRLTSALASGDDERRAQARIELDALGAAHPIVIGLDEQLFEDFDSDSRLFREYSTVNMRAQGEQGMASLLASLTAASAIDRAAAAQALGGFADATVVQALVRSLRDENWHVREWSARSLGAIGDRSAVMALVDALADENAAVREWSARALGNIADESAVDGLSQALGDADDEVREWAARSLGDIGSSRAVDSLIASLQDSDDDVREWALRALGDIGDRRATDAVAALLNDANADIREWSKRTLEDIQESSR